MADETKAAQATNVSKMPTKDMNLGLYVGKDVRVIFHDTRSFRCKVLGWDTNGLYVSGIADATFTNAAQISNDDTAFIPYSNILTVVGRILQAA